MYQIGDRIVYPMHGAGVIQSIENKEIQEETKNYYIIKLSLNGLQVMVPVGNEEKLGIRPVIDRKTLKEMFIVFKKGETDLALNCKERIKINSEKIKTGDIADQIEVVRDLTRIHDSKPLTSSEKKVYLKAKELLRSELVMVSGLTEEERVLYAKEIFQD